MDEIIKYLQTIENNLVGLILPSVITAAASLLTLAITSVMSFFEAGHKHNSEQFKTMQNLYGSLKGFLQELLIKSHEMKSFESLYGNSIASAIENYFLYQNDEQGFVKTHPGLEIEAFINQGNQYVEIIAKLSTFLEKTAFPLGPTFHPCIRSSVYKMLAELQKNSYVINELKDHPEEAYYLKKMIHQCNLDEDQLSEYLGLVDKWFKSYR